MVARHGEHAGLAAERRSDHEIGPLEGHPGGHDVDLALPKPGDGVLPGLLANVDSALRMPGLEGVDDLDKARTAGRSTQHAKPKGPGEAPHRSVGPLEHGI